MIAAARGNASIVKTLLERDADINARTNNETTALLEAVTNQHATVVKILLAGRADVTAKDKDGRTPLNIAAAKGGR